MILVTGGAFQGKRSIARKLCGKKNIRIADSEQDTPDKLSQSDVILHIERYIKKRMIQGKYQEEIQRELQAIAEANPRVIFTVTELGCGVVPMDKFDRAYRETCGRISCILASGAEEVHRVFCGIDTRIK